MRIDVEIFEFTMDSISIQVYLGHVKSRKLKEHYQYVIYSTFVSFHQEWVPFARLSFPCLDLKSSLS